MDAVTPAAVEKCASALRREYQRNATFRPLPRPGIEQVHVSEVYVECSLFKPDCVRQQYMKSFLRTNKYVRPSGSVTGTLFSMSEIFKPGKADQSETYEVDTVALIGPGGSGKTLSATKKLPSEWAEGKWMYGVVLLFVIPVHSLIERLGGVAKDSSVSAEAATLTELLRLHAYGLEESEVDDVLQFLRKNNDASKILVVVDGKRVESCLSQKSRSPHRSYCLL